LKIARSVCGARGRFVLAMGVWLCGANAGAQAPEPAEPPLAADAAQFEEALQRETERTWQPFGVARARISYPLVASTGVGVLLGERSREIDCAMQCELNGWLASVDVGVGGAQFNLGPAYLIGELGDNKFFLTRRYMGYAVRASVLRTWGDTWRRPDREWHIGLEGEFTVVSLNLTLGFYRRIGDENARRPWLVSGGIGWGF
jgi:hypothetical protein